MDTPLNGGFKVIDAMPKTAKGLTLDEARKIANGIAKLPTLLPWRSE